MRLPSLAVALTLMVSSCASRADPQAPATGAEALVDAYVEAFNAGDVPRLFALFDDDVSLSLRPLTWSPAEGPTEAVAATMQAVEHGWNLQISNRVTVNETVTGSFALDTHGPTLTGTVAVRIESGTIADAIYDLDDESKMALESPYLYLRTFQSFVPLEGARAFWGESEGAIYQIEMPNDWNGGLVIWGGGFKEFALGLGVSPPPVSDYLVRQGYAWAATSFSTNGFDPLRFTEDFANLHDHFIHEFGAPDFTYIAGSSMGGTVTLLSQQVFPDRYDGALAICGVVDQVTGPFFGHYLALAAYAARIGQAEFDSAPSLEVLTTERILPPLRMDQAARWRFEELITALTGGPRPFRREGFSEVFESNFNFARWVVTSGEFTNVDFVYPWVPALDVSPDELNERVIRIQGAPQPTDPSRLTGVVAVPTIMLHTTGDGQVPITAMQAVRRLADGKGDSANLVQRAIRSPGHCEFTPDEIERAMADLFLWVEQGIEPEGEQIMGALEQVGMSFTIPLREGDPGGL